jgi:hypothetical protein
MLRLLGTLFVVAACATLVYDTWDYIGRRDASLVSGYQLWTLLAPGSLGSFRAFVEQDVSPALWSNFVGPLLAAPAMLVLGVIALILMLAGRRRG